MEVENTSTDRISTLTQDIIENILTLLPIRDAIRTSILSSTWRFYWTNMPKLVFDDNLFKLPSYNYNYMIKYKFSTAIFHVLLQHTGFILEFHLSIGKHDMGFELDQILRHLLRSNKVNTLVLESSSNSDYKLPSSFFSLQGLEHLQLNNCVFESPLKLNRFSKLKSVCFYNVEITSKTLQHFLSSCPLLTDLILTGYKEDVKGGNKFTFVELLECVPLIKKLDIQNVNYVEYLSAGGMPHVLPTSPIHLKYLYLEAYINVRDQVSAALCLMRNSPNLEEITLAMNWKPDAPEIIIDFPDFQDNSGFSFNRLQEFTMKYFCNKRLECEIIKLIMAKSPMLKTAHIELHEDVSVEGELKILRKCIQVPFPRASASAITIIKRPQPSS